MASPDLAKIIEKQNELLLLIQAQMGTSDKSRVHIPWPAPLDVESPDPGEALDFFKTTWLNYATAAGLKKEQRPALLINAIGHAAMKKYLHFGLTETDKKSEDKIFEKLEQTLKKKTNIIYSRYLFNKRNQQENENIETYITELRKLLKSCNYSVNIMEEMLRDRIVVGIRSPDIKKELLRAENLDLDLTIKICKSAEVTAVQLNPEINNNWKLGFIVEKVSERSYKINVDGTIYRRDLVHIKPYKGTLFESISNTNKERKEGKSVMADNNTERSLGSNENNYSINNSNYGCEIVMENDENSNSNVVSPDQRSSSDIISMEHTRPVRMKTVPTRFKDYVLS